MFLCANAKAIGALGLPHFALVNAVEKESVQFNEKGYFCEIDKV